MLYNYTADLMRIEIRVIFEPLTNAIFQLCLLPKMRLSVVLEGIYIGYQFDAESDTESDTCY